MVHDTEVILCKRNLAVYIINNFIIKVTLKITKLIFMIYKDLKIFFLSDTDHLIFSELFV